MAVEIVILSQSTSSAFLLPFLICVNLLTMIICLTTQNHCHMNKNETQSSVFYTFIWEIAYLFLSLACSNKQIPTIVMLKTKFLFLLMLLFVSSAWADSVGPDEALQIAEHFFGQQSSARRGVKAETIRVSYTSLNKSGEAALYVINRGVNGGFVVVSGERNTDYPVLGWSDSGSFDYDKAPIQLKDMLEAYSHTSQKQHSEANFPPKGVMTLADGRMVIQETDGRRYSMWTIAPMSVKRPAHQHRIETIPTIVVQPLVKVQWDQGGQYSLYIDPYYEANDQAVAGCVPTAMAQIMAYWKYPVHGRGFHLHNFIDAPSDINLAQMVLSGQDEEIARILEQYARQYKVNYGESVYKWNEMGDTYPSTETECQNVSKLIFDCHTLCEPTKLPNNRGTGCLPGSAISALIRNFGYAPDIKTIQCEGNEDLMRQELDAKRPFLIVGVPSSNSIIQDAHAFVCDGYAEGGYFHMNFGWGGTGNGFYLLNNVNPNGSDFSLNQQAFIGIQPSLVAVEEGQAFVNVNADGVGVVVGGYGDVVVPATVSAGNQTYPVMKVNSHAFDIPTSNMDTYFEQYLKEFLTRITLPESVTEIGDYAFQSPYLTEVNLSGSIREIGANAFFYSKTLQKVSIPSIEAWLNIDFKPNTLESGFKQYMSNPIWSSDNKSTTRLYIGDEEATDIVIPSSVKEVRPYAFCGYQFINSVYMEEGVEKIGESAFERVPMKQLLIPSTLKELGPKAFYKHEVSTITIPANLINVGYEALNGDKISEYIVDEKNPKYSSYQGILYDKSRRTLVHCPNYSPGFQYDKPRDAVGVPSSVTTIRAHSFDNNLRKLTLPPSVRNVEDEAFINTYSLKELYVYTPQPLSITRSMFHLNATSMAGKINVHVPMGSGEAYRAADVWKEMNIVEDQAPGSLPLEHYDYVSDYNAIQITDYMPADGVSYMPQYYLFDTHPVITYSGTSMLITSATSQYLFEKNHYQDMYFTHYDDPDGIGEVESPRNDLVIRTIGDQLVIRGLEANIQVLFYSIEGKELASAKASAHGEVSMKIPMQDVIVVKAGNLSFKIHSKR